MAQDPAAEAAPTGTLAVTRAFLEGVRHEMKRVSWPTREELFKATRMIVILSIILGIVIGMVDLLLQLILVRGVAAVSG